MALLYDKVYEVSIRVNDKEVHVEYFFSKHELWGDRIGNNRIWLGIMLDHPYSTVKQRFKTDKHESILELPIELVERIVDTEVTLFLS